MKIETIFKGLVFIYHNNRYSMRDKVDDFVELYKKIQRDIGNFFPNIDNIKWYKLIVIEEYSKTIEEYYNDIFLKKNIAK